MNEIIKWQATCATSCEGNNVVD